MRKVIAPILLFWLSIIASQLSAQFFSSGQSPASVNWKQINTEHFQLIFPEYYEDHGQYLANVMERAYALDTLNLNARPRKIPMVLHTNTSISNGFVAPAPMRMELYTTPPQDMYAQGWLQQLALHEQRHVVQLSKMRQGMTKVLSWGFGQQAIAAVTGLYLPFWFLEGDAVSAETEFSRAGRGRQPNFVMPLRAQVMGNGLYHYDKAVFGSYRDFVPNHYVLGYHLVANGRRLYGPELWNHTLNNVAKRPYSIMPFNKGMKDVTGMGKLDFYDSTFSYLKQKWSDQLQQSAMPGLLPAVDLEDYTSYLFPYYFEDDTSKILALKTSIDDITRIVLLDENGDEEILFTPGFIVPDALAYRGDRLAWVERTNDPRWSRRDFTVIKIYNLKTGKRRQLSSKSHLFAPDFSCKGEKLLAVKTSPEGKYSIVILDAESGKQINEISTPDNLFFQTPAWGDTDDEIITVAVGEKGKTILLINPNTHEVKNVYPFTYEDIHGAVICHDTVYFNGTRSGVSDIYAFDLDNPIKKYKITSSAYGAADINFSIDGKTLLYSEYTPDGYRIARQKIDAMEWVPMHTVKNKGPKLYNYLRSKDHQVLSRENIPRKTYDVKKYSRLGHLFNFHSWAPLYIDVDNESFQPGISLMSQNILSSTFTTIGYEYDLNEEVGRYKLEFSYLGWYPAIDLSADYGRRKTTYYSDSLQKQLDASWFESNISVGARVPLNWKKNKFYRGFQPGVKFRQQILRRDDQAEATVRSTDISTLEYRMYLYNQFKMSHRDLFPRWGQVVDLVYRHAPFGQDFAGSLAAAELALYFPGFMRHHALRFYGGLQERNNDIKYFYPNYISNPRGYAGIFAKHFASFRLNYALPLFYPDFSIGPVAYIKRIRLQAFYDYAFGERNGMTTYYRSTGLELSADMHILRFLAPVALGVRGIYLQNSGELKAELIFGINFRAF